MHFIQIYSLICCALINLPGFWGGSGKSELYSNCALISFFTINAKNRFEVKANRAIFNHFFLFFLFLLFRFSFSLI
jgi:hypothetical protein